MKLKILILILISTLVFSCSNEKKNIELSQLVQRNNLTYEINKESPFSGSVFEKYQNGQNSTTGNFTNGLKTGTWTTFYDNGQKKSITNYSNSGLRDGIKQQFSLNGQITVDGNFSNNLRDGKWLEYYENGKKRIAGFYKDDKLDGKIQEYSNLGYLIKEYTTKNGIKDGLYSEWYNANQKSTEITYSNGKITNERFWNTDGTERPKIRDGIIGKWKQKNNISRGESHLFNFKANGVLEVTSKNPAGVVRNGIGSYKINSETSVTLKYRFGGSQRLGKTWNINYRNKSKIIRKNGYIYER